MSRRTGARWRLEVDEYLLQDKAPGWTFATKNEKNITLARYMDELNAETVNARAAFGAAVVKRRGKNIQDAYVVMPLWMFRKLLNTLYRLGWKP